MAVDSSATSTEGWSENKEKKRNKKRNGLQVDDGWHATHQTHTYEYVNPTDQPPRAPPPPPPPPPTHRARTCEMSASTSLVLMI